MKKAIKPKDIMDQGERQAKELAKLIITKLSVNKSDAFEGNPEKQMIACIATSYIFNELTWIFHEARQEQLACAQQLMNEETPEDLRDSVESLLNQKPQKQPNKNVPKEWYTKEDTYYG